MSNSGYKATRSSHILIVLSRSYYVLSCHTGGVRTNRRFYNSDSEMQDAARGCERGQERDTQGMHTKFRAEPLIKRPSEDNAEGQLQDVS
jgi:hypothetical protein